MTEENVVETENNVQEIEEIVVETITEDELAAVRAARDQLERAALDFERSVAVRKAAELGVNNIILKIYNKYKLTADVDIINGDGTIIRMNVSK